MWQVTRKAAELIKLVIVTMNTVLIYHATPTHAQGKTQNSRIVQKSQRETNIVIIIYYSNVVKKSTISRKILSVTE